MRSHRRRLPLDHVLVAGDVGDLDAIRCVLALLPADAYGQVLVQAPAGAVLADLAAPARVTLTRLDSGLADAVAGWVAEWMPEEHDEDREVAIWLGGGLDGACAGPVAGAERL